jgi:hypothetical protein
VLSEEMAKKDIELSILSSKAPFNVYIGYGEDSNPGKFEYDVLFKNYAANRKLRLNRENLPTDGGFTIAFEVNGYDYGMNTPHENILSIDSKTRGSADVEIVQREPIFGRGKKDASEVLFM